MEPDRQGKSKKQIKKEFVTESSCDQVYHGNQEDQAELQMLLHKQRQREKKK
mgnify:CR=1 FL=1